MTLVRSMIVSASIVAVGLAITPVSADIYKHVDENGNVSYSDKPLVGAEKIKTTANRSSGSNDSDDNQAASNTDRERVESPDYRSLQILTPREGKTFDPATSNVQVILLPTPSLGETDQLIINIDGKDISKGRDVNLSVQNLPKGKHSVKSRIEDSEGKVIIESASVEFSISN